MLGKFCLSKIILSIISKKKSSITLEFMRSLHKNVNNDLHCEIIVFGNIVCPKLSYTINFRL